jgi:diguanylate cyclase (GGDEF)-like protein
MQSPVAGHITVSVGLAEFNADARDARELFNSADAALYEAKRQGRDRICCSNERSANTSPAVGVK